jgi:hypothetical protein
MTIYDDINKSKLMTIQYSARSDFNSQDISQKFRVYWGL